MSLRFSSHSMVVRRLKLVLAGIGLLGAGIGMAQSRAERPMPSRPSPVRSMDRPMERPMERPSKPRQIQAAPRSTAAAPARQSSPRIIEARPMVRCTVAPNPDYWQRRDIMAEIQWMARRGSISVHPVGEEIKAMDGYAWFPAGWVAYGFCVPAGDSLKVSLEHPNRGWFRLMMVNKWGGLEEGMLQNVLHTYEPVVTYTNPSKETRAVYVIVDDPGWMSSKENPFNLSITRSWEPGQKKVDDAVVVTGIWAKK